MPRAEDALAQSLPGPASSQTGDAIGLLRAGLLGGFAAWLGFTLPSALLIARLHRPGVVVVAIALAMIVKTWVQTRI